MLVRAFRPDDVAFAAHLANLEGWAVTAQDYETLLELEPGGCFVAEVEGRPVGTVTSITYGKLGWIGNLVVERACRGRDCGRRLLDRAVAHLVDRGVRTVGLDATAETVSFYRRAGFRAVCDVLHLERPGLAAPAAGNGSLLPIEARHLHAVTVFDWVYFGGRRRRLLRALLQRSPVAYLAQDRRGVAGYLMARPGPQGWTIGPWVCVRAAELLLARAMAEAGGAVLRLGVPALNEPALRLLQEQGFGVCGRQVRMYHGDQEGIGQLRHIWAIASPDKG